MRNEKWLINCNSNKKTMISSHLGVLSKYLDLHSSAYEKRSEDYKFKPWIVNYRSYKIFSNEASIEY